MGGFLLIYETTPPPFFEWSLSPCKGRCGMENGWLLYLEFKYEFGAFADFASGGHLDVMSVGDFAGDGKAEA